MNCVHVKHGAMQDEPDLTTLSLCLSVCLPIYKGFVLCNMADMAYGTKLTRVTKEAEYIMEHERYFVYIYIHIPQE